MTDVKDPLEAVDPEAADRGGQPPSVVPPPAPTGGGPERLLPTNIEDEMRASYLDYAMSVIIGRALPDVRDGLKPVHRRVLFAMQELGNGYNRAYKKSARVVGDVIGKFHPHGDQAVYDTLVRMAQDFSMRHVLVDGQGNFGSIDGDPPAAMRYTEVRMAKLASEMLADIDKDTVDFGPNYDESLKEPLVMPARFPNLLVNGSSGIAVGMATNIAPHNLGEIIDATVALAKDPSLDAAAMMAYVPGPDFPTAGIVYGTAGLQSAYRTGRGVVQVRGRAHVEEGKRGERLVISEIPFQVNKTTLIEKIAAMVRDKRLEGISDIRDESDRDGMRVVIELKRDISAEVVLNQLYTNTTLQTSFGFNMLAIVNGQPRVLGLKDMLQYFIDHRRDVVTRRSRFELREARKRFNVVFGLLAAIDSIDKIIALIRAAADQVEAKAAILQEDLPVSPAFRSLCERLVTFEFPQGQDALTRSHLRLGEAQAQAILDMRLARLTGLERDKLAHEADELRQTIERLSAVLASGHLLLKVIVDELEAIRTEYAQPRRTELVPDARQLVAEDLIADDPMVVTVSHAGYVKRNPIDLYQAQRRGGRGKTAATTRDEDFMSSIFVATARTYLLIFTDRGKVYWLKVHEIPQAGRASRGKPIVNLLRLDKNEKIAAVLPVRNFVEGEFVVMATAKGTIKKTDLMLFAHPRPSGLIALSIDPGDSLLHVGVTDGTRDILMATREGLAIRFKESQVRPMGRTARGVRAISLKREGDAVVGMVICNEKNPQLLTICDNGFGKRTSIGEYRVTSRGGQGIINIRVSERNGLVAGVCGVCEDDEVMVVTNRGMMIRMLCREINQSGRAAQGVKIISIGGEETVSSVARIAERDAAQAAQSAAELAQNSSATLTRPVVRGSINDNADAEPNNAADEDPESDDGPLDTDEEI
jgi:DNA gyrase subunit A